jgi:hypothetical protein
VDEHRTVVPEDQQPLDSDRQAPASRPVQSAQAGRSYFPRDVFFFGFGFGLLFVPVAAACRFCFFDAM